MNIKLFSGALRMQALWLATAGTAWSGAYSNNWLEVRVIDRPSGAPVAQAAVCLGTTARSDQFGARRTSSEGTVRFTELPVNSMVLTASQRGYQGKQQNVEPLSGNRVIVVSLAPGGGGPVCDAPASPGQPAQPAGELAVTHAEVFADKAAESGDQVIVTVRVSGEANQIRIAETPGFDGAVWQDLKPENRYTVSPGKGLKRLFIQVRRQVRVKGASLEVLSPIRVVHYRRR